jgi:hypothetical protein
MNPVSPIDIDARFIKKYPDERPTKAEASESYIQEKKEKITEKSNAMHRESTEKRSAKTENRHSRHGL